MWKKLEGLLNSPWLALIFMGSLWLWRSPSLFTNLGLLPLHADQFENLFQLLGGHRLLLPHFLAYALGFIVAITPLLLLCLSYLCLRYFILSDFKQRALISFFVCSILLLIADPGQRPPYLASISYSLVVLCLFFGSKFKPLTFWIILNLLGWISFTSTSYSSFFVWILLSLSLRESLNFLIVEKSTVGRFFKTRIFRSTGVQIGIFLSLSSWLIWINFENMHWSIPELWWLSIVVSSLVIIHAWISPWATRRNLGLCCLSVGYLLIPSMLPLIIFIGAGIACEIIALRLKTWEKSLNPLLISTGLFALSITTALITTQRYSQDRSFQPAWIEISDEISAFSSNLSIVGNGIGFLSFFYRGNLVENPPILLERSEEKFLEWMKSENVRYWLIQKDFLMSYWGKLIQEGYNPDHINESVLSRLSLYQGKAVETKTLSLAEIKNLEVQSLQNEDFILIKRLSPQ